MKYDCTKTLDYHHEKERLCASFDCGYEHSCPLTDTDCNDVTEEHIRIVQKWSDEHPEPPKLTKAEHGFLTSFMFPDELAIRKGGVTMQLDTHYSEAYSNATIPLKKNMFQFIDEDKEWTVEELLKLEVEDER